MKTSNLAGDNLAAVPKGAGFDGVATAKIPSIINKRSNRYNHLPVISNLVAKVKARVVVKGVKKALVEVAEIESGKIKPKTLDQLLNEL